MSQVFIFMVVFLTGLVVGSFLNCVIYRLNTKESFLFSRSHCPKCHHILKWYDLIPILSFIIVKGKCRYCQKKISWQYPLVEIATGIVFLLILNYELRIMNYGFNLEIMLNSLFLILNSCFLIVIFVYDLKHYIIPDKIIYPAIITALIFNFQFSIFNSSILSGLGAAGFFFLFWLISRGRWMGFGDVKLGFFMGLFLSWPNILVALFSAFFIGAIIGIGLIALGKKTLKSQVPFAPFLVIGTFIALFFGKEIINWYMSLVT